MPTWGRGGSSINPIEKEQVIWLKKIGVEPAIAHYCIGQSRKPTLGLVFVLFVGRFREGPWIIGGEMR
ncbi:hypothetical protein GB937_000656 [Aspergillus fischeri]|nr:hypothetical protein GB937_000656 [Aspergillus fischeri]